jgi:hypothetical protein
VLCHRVADVVTGIGRAVSEREMQDMEIEREVAQEQPEKSVRVVVAEPFQVSHDGVDYQPGDTGEVPASVAEHWRANGWVQNPSAPASELPRCHGAGGASHGHKERAGLCQGPRPGDAAPPP